MDPAHHIKDTSAESLSQQDFSILQSRLLEFLASQEARETVTASKELTLLRQGIRQLKEKVSKMEPEEMTVKEKESIIEILKARIALKKAFLKMALSESKDTVVKKEDVRESPVDTFMENAT